LSIQGSQEIYPDLMSLVESAPELYGYAPAWNDIAKEVKKKNNLHVPAEEETQHSQRMERSRQMNAYSQ
jgi:hypothetical protein